MPSEMMNRHGLSPSFFHEEAHLSDERQVGTWKIDPMSGYYGLKSNGNALRMTDVASTALDNQMKKGLDLPEYYLDRGRNVNLSLASRSLPIAADRDLGARAVNMNKESASYFLNGDQYENVKSPLADAVYGHSVGPYEEEEAAFESLKDIEAQTIGNLLPDDDDDLFYGVNDDGFFKNNATRPNKNGEDMEDVDLFSSVGGLELGEDDGSELSDVNSNSQPRGGEHPSRTLFVRNINSNIQDSDLQKIFEQYGEIRTLYTACKHRGFVIVSYFDIRASCNAMRSLQDIPLMRRKLDIHFSLPKENSSEKDINQGTVMVFNHDASVSNDELREILAFYGEIKEIRESPQSSRHKFVEFYDVRAANSALHAFNRSDIVGKPITLEEVRPSGSKRLMQHISSSELDQEESGVRLLQHSPPNLTTGYFGPGSLTANRGSASPLLDTNMLHHHVGVSSSSSVPNGLSSLLVRRAANRSSIVAESADRLQHHLKFDYLQGKSSPHPHSLPDYHHGLTNGTSFGSPSTTIAAANITTARRPADINDNQQFRRISSNGQSMDFTEVYGSSGNGSSHGHHYIWGNPHHHHQSQAMMWPPSSPSLVVDGIGAGHIQQLHAVSPHMLSALLPLNNHHVGSAPSINPSVWDRQQHAYAVGGSPNPVVFHPGSLGNGMISGNPLEYLHQKNAFPPSVGNCVDLSKSIGIQHHPRYQRRSVIFPARGGQVISPMTVMSSFDSPPNERIRSRSSRNEFTATQAADNKKQFELDVDRILRGDDKRTTLMLKNIPNKYTSKMLLAAIDDRHKGTYDFIYLPIDFKNKCNVGYAFINMTDPSLIVPFYQTFNGKKWEKFNSEKVATLAYGRIQGKAALIVHFQNSSLMNEDKRCRPILFHTHGPKAGDQVPFPMGTNMRHRAGRIRAGNEENNQETPPNLVNKEEDYSNGDYSSSGSGKESD